MQIGRVAERTGLSIDAIRFYEKQRLLDHPVRSEGGFRLFHAGDVRRIQFIRSVQQLGFSLREIRELLVVQDDGRMCSHVRDLLRGKLRMVRAKVRELTALQRQLSANLRKCERNLKMMDNCKRGCPVVRAIARGKV